MGGVETTMACVQDEEEIYENLEVALKVVAGNKQKLDSKGKVLTIKRKKVPMSRFGTWVFYEISDENLVRQLLANGGAVVAITWVLYNCYPEITVWVNSVDNLGFTFDIKKSSKKKILDEITSGRMKKEVQNGIIEIADKHGVECYRDVKVKMIRIMPSKGQSERSKVHQNKVEDSSVDADYEKMKKLEFTAETTFLMTSGEFPRAFMRLRSALEEEEDPVWRIQLLMQTTVCATKLKNASECDRAAQELIKLLTNNGILSNIDSASFHDEITKVIVALINNSNLFFALEICFAAAELSKKTKDPDNRMENIYLYIDRAIDVIKQILASNPASLLNVEVERYLERIAKDLIPFMKKQKDVDDLVKYRYLYFSEHVLALVKNFVYNETSRKLQPLMTNTSKEFVRHSPWADYPFVITILSSNPRTQEFMADLNFKKKILEISKDPKKLTEMAATDLRIQATKEIVESVMKLREEFIAANDGNDNDEVRDNNGESGESSRSGFFEMFGAAANQSKTKQEQAVEEKEKGNDAYKKQNFDEAIAHYDKAIELDPTNMFFYSNKSAVYFSKEDWQACRDMCLKAMKVEQDHKGKHSVYNKDLAKVAARLARCEIRLNHSEAAMKMFDYSLKLHHDPQVASEREEHLRQLMFIHHIMRGNRFGF